MLMSASPKPMHLLLFYLLFSVVYDLVLADFPYHVCSSTVASTTNTQFSNNLDNLLLSLSSNASVSKFYNTSIGSDPNIIYGLLFCYKYVANVDCKLCIEIAREDIRRFCPSRNEGVVWGESCQLRYSNQKFFSQLDVSRNQFQMNPKNGSFEPNQFRSVVNVLLNNLTKKAAFVPSAGMYATGTIRFTDTDTIYALVQCTVDLSPTDCNTCLEIAMLNVSTCCYYSRGARLLSPSCYLRYEFYDFYTGNHSTDNQSTNSKKSSPKNHHWLIPVLAIGSAILVAAFLGSSVYCYTARNQSNKEENQISSQEVRLRNIGDPNDQNFLNQFSLSGRENLNPQEFPFFDLASLNAATNNFSDSNKLGQGGFGPVYKGILADGQEVAVKRLSVSSEQGLEEFTNEVLLLLKLQHKNLVRLLGFCIDGEEKLLIYEYMPNGSLNIFLFDCRKCMQLNWNIRLNIINGIARGMLYLHEDSRLRIIHRDLKASNVLLDNEMNPKISDFGLARIFGGSNGDATTTKIVGTYGYIAPEFAMEGLYSIKSDVFSFGVLLLEILSGKRNSGFHISNRAPSLLAYAWKLWNEAKGLELMDPLLNDSCCIDEFLKYMHIGLLCVQEDAYDRPTMSSVVVMLRSEAVTPLQPKRPAFSIGRFTDHYELNDHSSSSVNGLTDTYVLAR